MYTSEPHMTVGTLLLAILGVLFLSSLMAVVVGLVMVRTKAGRVILGVGTLAFMGLIVLGLGFVMIGSSRTEVASQSTTEIRYDNHRVPASSTGEIPLDTTQEAQLSTKSGKPQPPKENVEAEVEEMPEEVSESSTPARTLSSASDFPYPDIRPPSFPRPFGPYASGSGQRYASSASSDPRAEIERMRERAMGGLYERLHGLPSASSPEVETDEESAPSDPISEPPSIIPPGRPDWVEQAPVWEDDGTCLIAVSSGPFDRGMDCRKSLESETRIALAEFANDYLDNPQAAKMLGTKLDDLQESVVMETYHEELTPSIGPMQQWHSLLKFDTSLQQKLRELWQAEQQVSRVVYIGAGFFGLLGMLTIFYFGMALTGEGSKVSPWLVSAGTVVALGGLFVAGVIFVQSFPML